MLEKKMIGAMRSIAATVIAVVVAVVVGMSAAVTA